MGRVGVAVSCIPLHRSMGTNRLLADADQSLLRNVPEGDGAIVARHEVPGTGPL